MTSEAPSLKLPRADTLPVEEAARTTLSDLQEALGAVVAALPVEAARAVDLQRSLGLDKKLGWQLFKFVTASDPLSDLAYVPGEPSMRRMLAAAARRRVGRDITDRAAQAFKRFEAFVQEHGDRADLISLTSGLGASGAGDLHHDLRMRKGVFKGLTHIWGIKAEISISTVAFGSSGPGTQDTTAIRGEVGLQRLRRGVPLTFVASTRNNPTSGEPGASPWQSKSGTPSNRNPSAVGPHFLEEFCTQPLPQMETRVQPNGSIETDVLFPPSGRAGAITLYSGQHIAGTAQGEQAMYSIGFTVRIPAERLVCELLIPEGWSNPASVRAAVYGRRDMIHQTYERRKEDLLPQRETATYMGTLDTAPSMPGIPHHPRAVRQVLTQVGWYGARYDVYRCVVDYPVLHTMISLDVDAAKK